VRSPSEFAEDHLPGATSHPVLDDAERVRIGTLHAQESAFAARRDRRARIVARNIAAMLETSFAPSRATGRRSSIAGAAASAAVRSSTC
jgi:tRNA 2-selenouridine synthase